MASSNKIKVVGLVQKLLIQTNGVDGSTIVTELETPSLANLGPYVASITAHTQLEQFSANLKWKVVFFWSFDGITWSAPVDLFAFSTTGGAVIQTAYTDAAKLGLHMRYGIACAPNSGTNREWGTVSVVLAFEYRT